MDRRAIVEAAFLIPIREDKSFGSGRLHRQYKWKQLQRDLYELFDGWSLDPGLIEGVYQDPDTGEPVRDLSRRYIVALPRKDLPLLRQYLKEIGAFFKQKAIYLSVAGKVEFIETEYEHLQDTGK